MPELKTPYVLADHKKAAAEEDDEDAEDGRVLVRDFLQRIRPQMSKFLKSSSQPAVQVRFAHFFGASNVTFGV